MKFYTKKVILTLFMVTAVFLNLWAAARYRALASSRPGFKKFSQKLSF
jgi:hypothetical protein